MGGPHGPRRQRRARVDGLRDLRLRRRAPRRLGARRGRLLGPRAGVARRRALHRRPRPRGSPRRRPDGPHLRQPGGPERQPGPARRGARHPRDVRPHGDERRGDRRPHRGRAHVRQDARRGRPRRVRRRRARGRPAGAAGPRLAQLLPHRQGRGRDHERDRGDLDDHADAVVQQLLRQPVRLRMGADEEPGRRQPVAAEGRRRRGHRPAARRGRADAHPDDADDRPLAALRPRLRADLQALPREPGRARGRVRAGLVQADAPRHGADRPLPRPGGAERGAAVAGPGPEGDARARRGRGDRRPEGADPRVGTVGVRARQGGVGVGVDVPRQRQARRRQRGAHPPRAAERLGGQRPGRARDGAEHARGDPAVLQRLPERQRQADLARRPHRARRLRGRRAGGQGRRRRDRGPVHAGPHGRVGGADRRRLLRRARAGGGRLPQLPRRGPPADGRVPARRQGEPADAERPRDDGARGRHAGPRRERRRVDGGRPHRHPRDAHERLLREPARPRHDVDGDGRRCGLVRQP